MQTMTACADLATLSKDKTWQLHSQFRQTFNLVSSEQRQLLLVAPNSLSLMPGGLFLPEKDFIQLHSLSKQITATTLANQVLVIETAQQSFMIQVTAGPSTKLEPLLQTSAQKELTCKSTYQSVLDSLASLPQRTGFDIGLSEFTSQDAQELFQAQTDKSVKTDKSLEQLADWVKFLLGRGRGLTPSGDDFLMGWLLINQMNQADQLTEIVKERLADPVQQTTDVSQHYLSLACAGYYGRDQLALAEILQGNTSLENQPNVLKNIINHGQTSGSDFLAGVAWGIRQLLKKKNQSGETKKLG
ncbi:hypothetical protein BAU15_00875 [Enterococcus sp. JM4C]|uniref:DUF2877 domain-containing protein n=1 Tax=Candidatus Enterococcus huntleyi TaxID=1857217 RepID=UPI00137967E0|nr:DUF2877 domain-containing protein [Enterococcus sp. JM4C]KAF1299230.1 hypothetical protein BAU15_00875 [Enterococcus sp. JM4C]